MDVETIGGAVSGGLAAAVVSDPSGHGGEPERNCADCGTETLGRFCHNCGNPSHVHRTLLHLGEELLHGVMHFDSRVWRTLPLLVFRPGKLTREWVQGRRARYVSPLALFLFTIFVLFMALSYAPISAERALGEGKADVAGEMARQRAGLAKLEGALAKASPENRAEFLQDITAARAEIKASEKDLRELDQVVTAVDGDWKSQLAANAKADKLGINTGNKRLDEKIRHKLENPDLAIYKLQQTIYKFSFLLIPISIPFVALLFLWRRDVTLYDHGVFVLYSLTFMAALAMTAAVANRFSGFVPSVILALAPLAVPAHMFAQLHGAYGLKWFSAAWRTLVLMEFCSIALTLFVLAIIWLGLA